MTNDGKNDANLPSARFTTADVPPEQQFPLWQDTVASLMSVERSNEIENGTAFRADITGYDLGKMIFAHAHFDAESFTRTPRHIQRDGVDGWMIVFRLSGDSVSRSGDRVIRTHSGDLELRALGAPHRGRTSRSQSLYLHLLGDEFGDIAGDLDTLSHTVLSGTMGNLLKEFLRDMNSVLPTLTPMHASVVSNAAAALVRASIAPTAAMIESAHKPIAVSQLSMARRFIAANLFSPELDSESLSRHLNLSRRQLYNLFSSYGGVAAYIRRRRLDASHDAIIDPTDPRQIQTIAYDAGFRDPAQFSRLFRAEFGYAPSEAREAVANGASARRPNKLTIQDWLGGDRNHRREIK